MRKGKNIRDFSSEFIYRFSRSSAPGGQNVNKVSTRVEVSFSVSHSNLLSEIERQRLLLKLQSKLNNSLEVRVSSQESRSQIQNKQMAMNKLNLLLNNGLKVPKKRLATHPSKASRIRRLDSKRQHALKKKDRRRPNVE